MSYWVVVRDRKIAYGPSTQSGCLNWAESNPYPDQWLELAQVNTMPNEPVKATDPVPGFGVRFLANGANSPLVAWFSDRVMANQFTAVHVIHQAVVVNSMVTFS